MNMCESVLCWLVWTLCSSSSSMGECFLGLFKKYIYFSRSIIRIYLKLMLVANKTKYLMSYCCSLVATQSQRASAASCSQPWWNWVNLEGQRKWHMDISWISIWGVNWQRDKDIPLFGFMSSNKSVLTCRVCCIDLQYAILSHVMSSPADLV